VPQVEREKNPSISQGEWGVIDALGGITQDEWETLATFDDGDFVPMKTAEEQSKEAEKQQMKKLYGVFWILHTKDKPSIDRDALKLEYDKMKEDPKTPIKMATCGQLVRGMGLLDTQNYFSLLPTTTADDGTVHYNLLETIANYCETCDSRDGYTEYYVDQRSEIWFLLRQRINKDYPTTAKRVTGSILAAIVGLSSYIVTRDVFRAWTNNLRFGESDKVDPNEFTKAGVRYEPRVFEIFRRLVNMDSSVPGFYTDKTNENIGVSPDAITGPMWLLLDGHNAFKLDGQQPDFKGKRWVFLGVTIAEFKTSLLLLRDQVKCDHILQMFLEMRIPRSGYGWLLYWHVDTIRLWLVKYDQRFWDWIERRVQRFLDFVILSKTQPGVELDDDAAAYMAQDLHDEWYPPANPRYVRPWSKATAKFRPPIKPLIVEVLAITKSRCDQLEDTEFADRKVYPVDKPVDDPWFDRTWKSLCEEQKNFIGCDFMIHKIHYGEGAPPAAPFTLVQ
jgi:hypothetical protein